MRKNARTTRARQRAKTTVLTEQALAAVAGGHDGTIINENALPATHLRLTDQGPPT